MALPDSSSSTARPATRRAAAQQRGGATGAGQPPPPIVESGGDGGGGDHQSLAGVIERYLSLCLHPTALFLAERLYAEQPTDAHLRLVARCHLRKGELKAAAAVLQGSPDPENRYLYAHCCVALDRLGEAEAALLPTEEGLAVVREKGPQACRALLLAQPPKVPQGAAGLFLLGRLCHKAQRPRHALTYYRLALKLDPTLWGAYEGLCRLDPRLAGRALAADGDEEEEDEAMEAAENNNRGATTAGVGEAHAIFGPLLPPSAAAATSAGAGEGVGFPPPPGVVVGHDESMDLAAASASLNLTLDESTLLGRGPLDGRTAASSIFSTPHGGGGAGRGVPRLFPASALRTPHFDPSLSGIGGVEGGAGEGEGGEGGGGLFTTPNLTPIAVAGAQGGQAPPGTTSQHRGPARLLQLQTPHLMSPPPNEEGGRQPRVSFAVDSAVRGGRGVGAAASSSVVRSSARLRGAAATANNNGARNGQAAAAAASMPPPPPPPASASKRGAAVAPVSAARRGPSAASAAAKGRTGAAGAAGASSKRGGGVASQPQGQEEEGVVGVGAVMPLLATLGTAYQFLCQYRCRDALEVLQRLPPRHYHTGWVQQQVGRAFFEMADYPRARKALEGMQQVSPHRAAGLELLSTALWHLKQETALCFLAQKAVELDRRSPECWCAVGNCFSLQKEHETALKFFQRAIQLDPGFTYAYTLCGHEYVCNEDFDKAVACYRYALRLDDRHYNAWYGLGSIYFRQEKYELAEYHFARALQINDQSSVLHCYLGMVLHATGKSAQALDMLERASLMEPRNPQARFQRANVLMKLERLEEALAELEQVRAYAPREASVHYLMGKICKRLGRTQRAMRHLVMALDLDPKDANLVKAAIERLDEAEGDEEPGF